MSPIPSKPFVNTFTWGLIFCVSLIDTDAHQVHGDDMADEGRLTIQLTTGRTVSGVIDAQTDETRLWLRLSERDIILSSAFEWSEIELIHLKEKQLTRDDVLNLVLEVKGDTTPETELARRIAFWFPGGSTAPGYDEPMFPERAIPPPPQPDVSLREATSVDRERRITSLEIEAFPMNWDRDPELDGLLVMVRPLDANENVVPVRGQIRLQLYGERYAQSTFRSFDSSILFPQLGTWTERLDVDDFGRDGAAIKLPYRRLNPDLNTDLAAYALLTARMGVAGQGSFDASVADVLIRPASRYRDELFQRSPHHLRFRPEENRLRR
ncbi:MAG: hypothetical protein O3A29_18840 [Planctomycetota bacterium]|nr:hypothetical protein [Planctomycetota bacterium]